LRPHLTMGLPFRSLFLCKYKTVIGRHGYRKAVPAANAAGTFEIDLLYYTDLFIDGHLHETTLRTDALDTDGRASVWVHHTRGGCQRIPILIGIVEH